MSVDVVCFGETMALLAPDPPVRLATATRLVLSHAGAESNVAVSLAGLGTRVQWCSRLGDDPFGQHVLNALAAAGVDIAAVRIEPGARTGVFFKDPGGGDPGAGGDADGGGTTTVHYYRDGSAASHMDVTDAERALAATPRLLHLSGITPALSPSCAAAVTHAVDRAHEAGCTVSFDVNHRPALWADDEAAGSALLRLAQRCDIVFVGLDEAARLWGTTAPTSVRTVLDRPSVLVVKDGSRSASSFEGGHRLQVPALPVQVVEAVGAGDAFAAGWLHARLAGRPAVEQLRLGHLVAARSLSSVTDHGAAATLRGLPELAGSENTWPPPTADLLPETTKVHLP